MLCIISIHFNHAALSWYWFMSYVSALQWLLGCRDRSTGVSDEGPCPYYVTVKERHYVNNHTTCVQNSSLFVNWFLAVLFVGLKHFTLLSCSFLYRNTVFSSYQDFSNHYMKTFCCTLRDRNSIVRQDIPLSVFALWCL